MFLQKTVKKFIRKVASVLRFQSTLLPLKNLLVKITRMNADGTRFLDSTGNYEVGKGVSLAFDGVGYGEVDLTGYEHYGAEVHEIELWFYNHVEINKDTPGQWVLNIGSVNPYSGIAFGAATGSIEDEYLTLFATNRRALNDGGSIPTGIHILRLVWNSQSSHYDIYLDGALRASSQSGPQAVWLLDRLEIANYNETNRLTGTNLWGITLKGQNGNVLFSNPLAQISDTGYLVSEVGPHVQLVNMTVPDCFHESVLFGYTWGADGKGFSEYDGTEGVSIGGTAVVGKIPASLETPGVDVFGNPLTHTGKPQYNFKALGYTGQWDGVAYATLSTPVVLPAAFRVVVENVATGTLTGDEAFLGDSGSNAVGMNSSGSLTAKINGSWVTSNTGVVSADTTYALIEYARYVSGEVTLALEGNVIRSQNVPGSVEFTYLWKYSVTQSKHGASSLKIYDSNDTLIHHWIVESRKDSEQSIIYDIVGGNHATLVNATVGEGGFWSVQKEGSLLAEGGFTEGIGDGVELSPVPLQITNAAYTHTGSNVYRGNGVAGGLRADVVPVDSTVRIDFEILEAGSNFVLYAGGQQRGVYADVGRYTVDAPYETSNRIDFYSGDFTGLLQVHSIQKIPKGQIPRRTHEYVTDGVELVPQLEGVSDGTDPITLDGFNSYGTPVVRTIEGEKIKLTTDSGSEGLAYEDNTLSIGDTVRFMCDVEGDLGLTGVYCPSVGDISTLSGQINMDIGVVSTPFRLYFRASNNSAGTAYYSNISVQKINLQPTTKQLSCLGQPLTHKAGQLQNAPCDIEAVPSVAGYLADATEQLSAENLLTKDLSEFTTNGSLSAGGILLEVGQYAFTDHVFSDGEKYKVTYHGSGTVAVRQDTAPYTDTLNDLPYSVVIESAAPEDTRVQVLAQLAPAVITGVTVQEYLDPTNLLYEPDGDTIQRPATDLVLDLGEELWVNPTTMTVDASNYSTYDPDTGICRIVSTDGTFVSLEASLVLTPSSDYFIVVEILEQTGGDIKIGSVTTGENIQIAETVGINITAAGADFVVARNASVPTDVTFKLSVREILGTQSNLNNQVFIGSRGMLIYKEPQTDKAAGNAAIAIGA